MPEQHFVLYRERIHETANQCKMLYKGGEVNEKCMLVALKIFITLANLSFFCILV